MELVLMGVAGCSAIDMISILKNNVKKSLLSKLRWRRTRVQVGEAKPFKTFM
jgi:putative redox protein